MKKLSLILIPFFLCACSINININNTSTNEENIISNIIENTTNEVVEEKYVDNNPIKLSLYIDNDKGGLTKVTDEYKTKWILKKDIVVFGAIYSEEEELASDYFQNIWKNNASKYENYLDYKIGWQVSFTLKDGTKINRTILKPSDVDDFYNYLELYLYDSANQPIGVWYSHMLDSEMTDQTVLTSLKLTAGSEYEKINSEISVMVFTYHDDNDFDENKNYRGNSKYFLKIYNE